MFTTIFSSAIQTIHIFIMYIQTFLRHVVRSRILLKRTDRCPAILKICRPFSTQKPSPCRFGLLLDIDGVILRGSDVLPGVDEAFDYLTDTRGNFRVPTVFVTNASNCLRATKSAKLEECLGLKVDENQVLLAHSPLKMFKDFHEKHVLICGQGPILDIAKGLGFKHTTTIDDLRDRFSYLDCVDYKMRRDAMLAGALSPRDNTFPRIDAIVLFGEPVRWETSLQLIIDTLMTDGWPGNPRTRRDVQTPYPHIPILACNMDLLWVAEAPLPRIGHGTFMLCLETLYKKLTGNSLQYTALMGKPSELTYHHAEYCVKQEALKMGIEPPRTLYAIGDNPESDILGANLFNKFLEQRAIETGHLTGRALKQKAQSADGSLRSDQISSWDYLDLSDVTLQDHGAEHCYSILVKTGIYSAKCKMNHPNLGLMETCFHLSQLLDDSAREPTFVEQNILSAIKMIFEREQFV